jgi:hypothetical protein
MKRQGNNMTDTATTPKERREKLEDILVVDCDVHVHESPAEPIPYCDMPWKVALENIKDGHRLTNSSTYGCSQLKGNL